MSKQQFSDNSAERNYNASPERFYALTIILLILFGVAIANRMYFLSIRGGMHADQFDWAMTHYFGGLTRIYIHMRDVILSGEAETKIFRYLPGYPAFLSIVEIIFTDKLIAVRMIQSVLDSLIIFPLYYLSYQISRSSWLALIPPAIYATVAWWAAGSTYLVAESLVSAMLVLLLVGLASIREHPDKAKHWIALGVFAAILPFFRSEFVLLFIPLGLWAILVTRPPRRLLSTVCVVAAFAAPLFAWIVRNYLVHGYYLLTPPAKWYAAWSGLGQLPNDYGYIVSDVRAKDILNKKGMAFNSPQSEAYWKAEYVSAWLEHPEHVLQTILFRLKMILTEVDYTIIGLTDHFLFVIICAAPFALAWLLWNRRLTDALLVSIPVGYALCSLGILYVELRYVRYASLTYALAFPVFLGAAADLPSHFTKHWNTKRAGRLKAALASFALAGIGAHFVIQSTSLRSMAVSEVYSERVDFSTVGKLPWIHDLESAPLTKAMSDVTFAKTALGLRVSAEANSGLYLLTAPLESGQSDAVLVRYRIHLEEGGLGLGVLSNGNQRWLSYNYMIGKRGSVIEGEFVTRVEDGSHLVVTAEGGKGNYSAVIQDLRWKGACLSRSLPEPPGLVFDRDLVMMEPCLGEQSK
ncbi:MAG: glycosyltransferase family 39 protein [Alphaproteobacteria bacterium]|nr:glycosyltransferase family 39 protein [Alphaproteobacteria bacterium]